MGKISAVYCNTICNKEEIVLHISVKQTFQISCLIVKYRAADIFCVKNSLKQKYSTEEMLYKSNVLQEKWNSIKKNICSGEGK